MVLSSAITAVPSIRAAALGSIPDVIVDVPVEEFLRRVHCLVCRAAQSGGRAYIGSTADPQWRWRGGTFFRAGRDGAGECVHMDGHALRWRAMLVLGAWADSDAAYMEELAIEVGRAAAPGILTNIADDARGLATRAHAYSFVYLCLSRSVEVMETSGLWPRMRRLSPSEADGFLSRLSNSRGSRAAPDHGGGAANRAAEIAEAEALWESFGGVVVATVRALSP